MIWLLYALFTVLCVVLSLTACIAGIAGAVSRRGRDRRETRVSDRYMRMVMMRLLEGESTPMSRFPGISRRGSREILARTLASVSRSTYIDATGTLRRIAVANGVEGWLLRRIRLSRGFDRARYMWLLSSLPVSAATAGRLRRYYDDRNRHVRFGARLVNIASDPSSAISTLDGYPWRFTPFEMIRLTGMLRRGLLPLACNPLLMSPSPNLRMLGMNIVRIFGLSESEDMLRDIVATDEYDDFRDDAIYVMISLHLPLSHECVAGRIRLMSAESRRSLYRRLASEGYSVSVLSRLACDDESEYVESLVASYKRCIVCM